MFVSLTKMFRSSTRTTRASLGQRRRVRPEIEGLEDRRLMATAVTPSVALQSVQAATASPVQSQVPDLTGTWRTGNSARWITLERVAPDTYKQVTFELYNGSERAISARALKVSSPGSAASDGVLGTLMYQPSGTYWDLFGSVRSHAGEPLKIRTSWGDYVRTATNTPETPATPTNPTQPKQKPDLVMLAARYDTALNRVLFDYRTNAAGSTAPMSGSFKVGLYASSDGVLDAGDARIATLTNVNGARTSDFISLDGVKIDGATHLFVVADPGSEISESSDTNNSARLELPDLQVTKAGFKGSLRTVAFHYSARNAASATAPLNGDIKVGLYWSKDASFDAKDALVDTVTVKGTDTVGVFQWNTDKLDKLMADLGYRYLLVVADPERKIAESKEHTYSFQTNNVTAFQYSQIMATYSSITNELYVKGTDQADTIHVRQDGNQISVEGATIFVTDGKGDWVDKIYAPKVGSIKVSARGGDDTVRLDKGTQPIYMPSIIWGGAGNDTIYGGEGNDQLIGDQGIANVLGGDDRLFGLGGVDKLFGEDGYDWLDAGSADELANVGPTNSLTPTNKVDGNAYEWAINGTSASDFTQSTVMGNCFVLAPLASLAQRGVNLKDRVRYKGNNIYEVKIFDARINRFIWQEVTFDGTFAKTDPQPTSQVEFWPILFRRAYRNMTGVVDNGGFSGNGLTAMTGRAFAYSPISSSDADFAKIEQAVAAGSGRYVTAGTFNREMTTKALVGQHAYAVLGVQRNAYGKPLSVTLWNPHGYQVTVSWVAFYQNFHGVYIS